MAAKDPEWFLEEFAFGHDGKGNSFPVWSRPGDSEWPAPKLIWHGLQDNRLLLVHKARSIGASWGSLAILAAMATVNPRCEGVVVSDVIMPDGSAKLLSYAADILQGAHQLGLQEAAILRRSAYHIQMKNGSRLFATSSIEPLRGSHPLIALVDEGAFHRKPVYAAVRPALMEEGRCIYISTANGVGNQFHEIATDAFHYGSKQFGFKGIFLPWTCNPNLAARPTGPNWFVNQEYPGPANRDDAVDISQSDEAFILSGNLVFDMQAMDRTETAGPLAEVPMEFTVPGLMVFHLPVPGARYIIGGDSADMGGDFSAACVLDAESAKLCATLHGDWPVGDFADRLLWLNSKYTGPCAPERNGQGVAVVEKFKAAGSLNLYMHNEDGKWGFPTTSRTKPLIVNTFEAALREGQVPDLCEGEKAEARSFQFKGTHEQYGAVEGAHDDMLMARMIAWWVRGQMRWSG